MNDTVLEYSAIQCLIDNFGIVQTERFISLMLKEPFDYTKWQRGLYKDKSVDEIFHAASDWKKQSSSPSIKES